MDLTLPKNKLIVMTGLSGSGKTSLAFDTIYEEGRRRYVESLSAYARQFLGNMEKPDVDSIEGLSPAISVDQKTTSHNPRSTVGTVTEIYDYVRLLYARAGTPYCPHHHIEITSQSIQEMTDRIIKHDDAKVEIMAPVVRAKKGRHENEIDELRRSGYTRIHINGEQHDLDETFELDKNIRYDIDVIIDRIKIKEGIRSRLFDSLETAANLAEGLVKVSIDGEETLFSEQFSCPICGFTVGELEPRLFSFNAPQGACEACSGLGFTRKIDLDLLIPDPEKSIKEGVFDKYANTESVYLQEVIQACQAKNIAIDTPFEDLPKKQRDFILYGSDEAIDFSFRSKSSNRMRYAKKPYEGIVTSLERRYVETSSRFIRKWIEGMMRDIECEVCHGKRLDEKALSVYLGGINIDEFTAKSIKHLLGFLDELTLNPAKEDIAGPILKEIKERLSFLYNVGLDYLTLSRASMTLSGGEAQRIRLATQIGSRLTGILYVLDEPSIGLHQRDNRRLIETLKGMRDLGNTMIVVEHDMEMIESSDFVVDIGPGAGERGGKLVFAGTPEALKKDKLSITGKYLRGDLKIPMPDERRKHERGYVIIKNARHNNLKHLDIAFPVGLFTVVTGVSGSGKSSLVNDTLYKGIAKLSTKRIEHPGPHDTIENHEAFDRVVDIDQSAIGRTPRSNPATYTGVFDEIRKLFASTNEAKLRGYKKGRFSFNVKGGRCEHCRGDGVKKIEMHFMPDLYVECEVCHGKRYNEETLQVKYKGKNIADVLQMTVDQALDFFKNIPKIKRRLQTIHDVGLGYIKLGQPSPTLSGGEAQRVKLASELHKHITDSSLYILDEPTTGLHSHDIINLVNVLQNIVDKGATVVVIEHNLDIIKVADHIIDLGPEGGDAGGEIVATGTPEEVSETEGSYTGQYLKKVVLSQD